MDIFARLKENKLVIAWSIFISILCHGFRMSSLMYSHDSLFISQNDYLWQINLGRFGQRVVPILIYNLSMNLDLKTLLGLDHQQ